jgi:hypothetical protein
MALRGTSVTMLVGWSPIFVSPGLWLHRGNGNVSLCPQNDSPTAAKPCRSESAGVHCLYCPTTDDVPKRFSRKSGNVGTRKSPSLPRPKAAVLTRSGLLAAPARPPAVLAFVATAVAGHDRAALRGDGGVARDRGEGQLLLPVRFGGRQVGAVRA